MKKFLLTFLATLVVASSFSVPTASAAKDIFKNWNELSSHYQEGKDFTIETQSKPNDVIILAIHGGRVEKGDQRAGQSHRQG